jgi:hypothetical protein
MPEEKVRMSQAEAHVPTSVPNSTNANPPDAAATGLAQANSHLPDLSLIVQHAATLASDAAFGNSGLSFTPGGSLPDPAASQAVLVANLGHHST